MTTSPSTTTDAPLDLGDDEELLDAVVQTAFTVTSVLNRVAAKHDLSLTQLRTLGILRDRTPRIAVLADFLGLEKSTMSGLISRAEQRGLLERSTDPDDARATIVAMTDVGLELADKVRDEVHQSLRPLLRSAMLGEHQYLVDGPAAAFALGTGPSA
ncbi:MarR family winged helix-turn-helix transcriptional regulator [Nocardioides acrostichi]|uniref:MarR family transcriptional regulator n=1 Tax=Nocardioides acrostichi TaxID=2784339 RepID=A0A930UVG7_9ACTN|nr:MarR family transcriptional regulator [Nocardioides acrostichi]MBF4161608.1 MarR family transcriptional regulator [Nocardioides acrostichi]